MRNFTLLIPCFRAGTLLGLDFASPLSRPAAEDTSRSSDPNTAAGGAADLSQLTWPLCNFHRLHLLIFGFLLVALPGYGEVMISEFVSSKAGQSLQDEDGQTPDWLELYNPTAEDISLHQWYLTDDRDDPRKWRFPEIRIPGNGFVVIFASGKNTTTKPLHTNFKLAAEGEYLALVAPDGTTIVHALEPPFPAVNEGASLGFVFKNGQLAEPRVLTAFSMVTPGEPNAPSLPHPVPAPTMSAGRGFYDEPITLHLQSETPASSIRYSMDGSQPSSDSGILYDGPIDIDQTTVFRAIVIPSSDGMAPSKIVTHTFVFPNDVIKQGAVPPQGWPAPRDAPDRQEQDYIYGMLPAQEIDCTDADLHAAILSLPSISLVTDLEHLFDEETGIYHNANGRGREWERPVSAEWIDPRGEEPGFQIDAGFRMRGGGSRRGENPKHAFRLYFRKDYGPSKLRYPLFQDEGVSQFDDICLRTAQNNAWSFKHNEKYTFLRDVFVRDCQRDMGQPYTRSRFCHLFLNGLYWGLYQTQEHSEASFAEAYFGGESSDYDVVKPAGFPGGNKIEATDGDLELWRQIWEISNAIAASDDGDERRALFERLQGNAPDGTPDSESPRLLDVENLIDYMILNFYAGNTDGPIPAWSGNRVTRNWFSIGDRTGRRGFQFFHHDSEKAMEELNIDRTGPYLAGSQFEFSNPQWFHQQLTAVEAYRDHFARRAHAMLTNRGALSESASAARLRRRVAELENAVVAESARWGRTGPPYKKSHWNAAVEELFVIVERRNPIVLDQLRQAKRYRRGDPSDMLIDAPLYPAMSAPVMRPPGGYHSINDTVSLDPGKPGSGPILFTIDGSDPKLPDGSVNDASSVMADNASSSVTLTKRHTTINARQRSGETWSPLRTAVYKCGVFPADATNCLVTELMYHPGTPSGAESARGFSDRNEFEYIEILNTSDFPVDLAYSAFVLGVRFVFPDHPTSILEPGARGIIAGNKKAFVHRYGSEIDVLGEFSGRLSNSGETLHFIDASGRDISRIAFDDSEPWPEACDGQGNSLVLTNPLDPSDAGSWRASASPAGNPGRAEPSG